MPYGLFDYGGTINTMGLSPVYEPPFRTTGLTNRSLTDMLGGNPYTNRMPEEGNQMVTRAIPEEAQITTAALFEEGNPYTDKAPEHGPIQPLTTMMVGEEEPNYNPTTLAHPENGPVPPTGGTGGCPAGYAPAQASPPTQYRVPIGEGRSIPAPMPILPTSRPRGASNR